MEKITEVGYFVTLLSFRTVFYRQSFQNIQKKKEISDGPDVVSLVIKRRKVIETNSLPVPVTDEAEP